jgi:dTDP-glucose 4,6-dehydratase
METSWLVTGGAGFIGSNFVHAVRASNAPRVVNLDLLTYAGNPDNLSGLAGDTGHLLVHGNICDRELVHRLLREHRPSAIVNFAAESHVDRSILDPDVFVRTNVNGTFTLLSEALDYWRSFQDAERENFRFLHVSTDEVYGSLKPGDPAFTETTPYTPNSPYSASKAASDHLVRAYFHTYGLPVLTTNCSNNYGPYQFPEKLIPLVMVNCLAGRPLPIYGDGQQIRDWLYVEDHCSAIRCVLDRGRVGETYNIGGWNEQANINIVRAICALLDELAPVLDRNVRDIRNGEPLESYAQLITHVADRLGHDRRYAIDAGKIERELGWKPAETFETGIRKTVQWYLSNQEWVENVQSGNYREWVNRQYDSQNKESVS